VFLDLFTLLIAVKLFDEMVDLLRVALFVGYLSQVLPLFTWIAGHTGIPSAGVFILLPNPIKP
jgi:hypothetical protein